MSRRMIHISWLLLAVSLFTGVSAESVMKDIQVRLPPVSLQYHLEGFTEVMVLTVLDATLVEGVNFGQELEFIFNNETMSWGNDEQALAISIDDDDSSNVDWELRYDGPGYVLA